MSDPLSIALSTLSGLGLGVVFFGGLWWTVTTGLRARRPALLFAGSLLIRMGVAVTGIYYTSSGNLDRLLSCVAGFLIARVAISRWSRAQLPTVTAPADGGIGAPHP